jgi:hypothetical protein
MDTRRAGFASVLATRLDHAVEQARHNGELTPSTDRSDAIAAEHGRIVHRADREVACANVECSGERLFR